MCVNAEDHGRSKETQTCSQLQAPTNLVWPEQTESTDQTVNPVYMLMENQCKHSKSCKHEHNKPKYNSETWAGASLALFKRLSIRDAFSLRRNICASRLEMIGNYPIFKWNEMKDLSFISVLIEVKINHVSSSIRYRFNFKPWNLNH